MRAMPHRRTCGDRWCGQRPPPARAPRDARPRAPVSPLVRAPPRSAPALRYAPRHAVASAPARTAAPPAPLVGAPSRRPLEPPPQNPLRTRIALRATASYTTARTPRGASGTVSESARRAPPLGLSAQRTTVLSARRTERSGRARRTPFGGRDTHPTHVRHFASCVAMNGGKTPAKPAMRSIVSHVAMRRPAEAGEGRGEGDDGG